MTGDKKHSGAIASVLVAALLSACGGAANERSAAGTCPANLLPGDLVISEVMADPAGTDAGKEWVEIYNATGGPVAIGGAQLLVRAADGKSKGSFSIPSRELGSGEYLVLGSAGGSLPPYMDIGYGKAISTLPNGSGGSVSIECNGVIDEVMYPSPRSGAAWSFGGELPPDAAANDDESRWCAASSTFEEGAAGTPGAKNDPCSDDFEGGTCLLGGEPVDVVHPKPGQLRVTEVMADPYGAASEREWIELYAAAEVDLNGVVVRRSDGKGTVTLEGPDAECLRVAAGGYAVLARSTDSALNGGLGHVVAKLGFSLINVNGTGIQVALGEDLLDEVFYDSKKGTSWSMDVSALGSPDGAGGGAWCFTRDAQPEAERCEGAAEPCPDVDAGTPGGPNPPCPEQETHCNPSPGQCCDPETGESRVPVSPGLGDIVITEVMASPSGPDATREWLELFVRAGVDLNGVTLERDGVQTKTPLVPEGAGCHRQAADGYAVVARETDSAQNGALDQVVAKLGFALVSEGTIRVVVGGDPIDEVTYASKEGASTSLDPTKTDPEQNDSEASWCFASQLYEGGDCESSVDTCGPINAGSPGKENPPCPGATGDCKSPPDGTCCEPGAGEPRPIVQPEPGDLRITEIMANPKGDDSKREWFEVFAASDVDLNGLSAGGSGDVAKAVVVVPNGECRTVAAGAYVVFARSDEPLDNGGLPQVDVLYGGLNLKNGADSTVILAHHGIVIDLVTYVNAPTDGASLLLDEATGAWCAADGAGYGEGGVGSPGQPNPTCE